MSEQGSELEFQRAELNRIHQEVDFKLHDADERERRIRFREQEIKTALVRFERLNVTEQKMVELQHLASEFDVRGANLTAAESLLAEQQVQLAQQRRELEQQDAGVRKPCHPPAETDQSRKRRTGFAAVASRTTARPTRGELEQRQAALEQLQEELRSAQREVLEIRLATEETWLQLQGVLAPASLSRSISQLRVRLADHFHLAADEALNAAANSNKFGRNLPKSTSSYSRNATIWNSGSTDGSKTSTSGRERLISREQELDAQQRHYEHAEKAWQSQQLEYQREMQRLLGKRDCA